MNSSRSKSKLISLFVLIPALLLGIISVVSAFIGFGLIPVLPAGIGIILGIVALKAFKGSFPGFAKFVVMISLIAAVISLFRGVVIKEKVAADSEFDSTLVKTRENIEKDLNDAFGDAFGE